MNTIPFSSEAVNTLVALEREHRPFLGKSSKESKRDHNGHTQYCSASFCYDKGYSYYPCSVIVEIRKSASEETKTAVALILGGGKIDD